MKNIEEIYSHIDKLLDSKKAIVIAIDGMSCSGKTTLANKIANKYNASTIHMDDFFLPLEKRTEERLNEAGGNFDRERFKDEIMKNIGNSFSYGKFNCKKMKIDTEVFIKFSPVTIIEGSYSMHPELTDIYDLKICTKVSETTQITRLKQRESISLIEKFLYIWIPMENKYHEYYKIYEKCDLIYTN